MMNYVYSLVTATITLMLLYVLGEYRVSQKQKNGIFLGLFGITVFLASVIQYHLIFSAEWYEKAVIVIWIVIMYALSKYRGCRMIFTFLFIAILMIFIKMISYGIGQILEIPPGFQAFILLLLGIGTAIVLKEKYVPFYSRIQEKLKRGWGLLCSITGGLSYLLYYLVTENMNDLWNPKNLFLIFMVLVVICLFQIFVIWLFQQFIIQLTLQHDREFLQFQEETLEQQLKVKESARKEIYLLAQEMHHYGNNIISLLEHEDKESALKAAESFVKSVDRSSWKQYCQLPIINSVVGYYAEQAENYNISINIRFQVEEQLSVPEIEFGILLSNALENAMKACRMVPEKEKRYMEVLCIVRKHLMVRITNTFSGEITFDKDGIPCTEEKGHGIGSHSIMAFAKKYHGSAQYMVCENQLILQILVEAMELSDK